MPEDTPSTSAKGARNRHCDFCLPQSMAKPSWKQELGVQGLDTVPREQPLGALSRVEKGREGMGSRGTRGAQPAQMVKSGARIGNNSSILVCYSALQQDFRPHRFGIIQENVFK